MCFKAQRNPTTLSLEKKNHSMYQKKYKQRIRQPIQLTKLHNPDAANTHTQHTTSITWKPSAVDQNNPHRSQLCGNRRTWSANRKEASPHRSHDDPTRQLKPPNGQQRRKTPIWDGSQDAYHTPRCKSCARTETLTFLSTCILLRITYKYMYRYARMARKYQK